MKILPRSSNGLERWLIGGLMLAGLALWPGMPLGFTLPKLLVLQVVALGWILSKQRDGFPQLTSSWVGRLVGAYFGVLGIYTFIFSIAPWTSLWGSVPHLQGFMTQWIYLVFFVMGLIQARAFQCGVAAMNLVVVAYGLLQIVGLDPLSGAWETNALLGRTFSSLGNPNFLGAFLALTLFVAWPQWPTRFGFRTAALFANAVVLLGTVSKGAYLGVAVALLLSAWFERKKLFAIARKNHRRVWTGLLAVALLALWGFQTWTARYELSSESGRSLSAREVLWKDTIELIVQQPWGYGLDTLAYVYGLVQSIELLEYDPFTVMVDRAHNVLLDLWITAGPVAVLVWFTLMAFVLAQGLKHPKSRWLSLGLVAYLVTLMVGFETVLTGAVAWGVIGSILYSTESSCTIHAPMTSRFAWVVLAIPLLIAFPITLQHARADLAYHRAEQALTLEDYDTALGEYANAVSLTSTNRTHLLKTLEVALVMREQTLSPDDQAKLDTLIDTTLTQISRLTNGYDPFLHSFLAWQAALAGDSESALRSLELAEVLAPNHPLVHKLAHHLYEGLLNEPEKAATELEILHLLMPSYLEEDPSGDAARIFLKENAWLETLLTPDPSTL